MMSIPFLMNDISYKVMLSYVVFNVNIIYLTILYLVVMKTTFIHTLHAYIKYDIFIIKITLEDYDEKPI